MFSSNSTYLFVSIFVAVFLVIACEGPQGPEGPQGSQGPQGPQGPQGEEGNANVASDSVTITDSDWQMGWYSFRTSPTSSLSREALVDTLEVPALSQSINRSGMVILYFKNINDRWVELPFEMLAFGDEYYYNLRYSYSEGEIFLYYFYTPNSQGSSVPDLGNATLPDYKFKWVVASSDAASKMKETDINLSNHDEVMKYLKKNYQQGDSYIIRQN